MVCSRIFFGKQPLEIFVCFSFLFGYFEIAGQNDPKRRLDFFFFSTSRSIFFQIGFLFFCLFFCFLTLFQIYCQGFPEPGNKSGLWSMWIWFPFGSELYSFELYECLDEFMEDKLSSSTDTFISTPPKKKTFFGYSIF